MLTVSLMVGGSKRRENVANRRETRRYICCKDCYDPTMYRLWFDYDSNHHSMVFDLPSVPGFGPRGEDAGQSMIDR